MGGHGSEKQRLPRRPGEEPWSLVAAAFALVISVGEDENLWDESYGEGQRTLRYH